MYINYFKRVFDFLSSIAGLLVLSPILLVLIIFNLIIYNGKPFFLQERPGKDGKLFKIVKLRTMKDFNPKDGIDIHSPKRITRSGTFIRKNSLDELFQLVNVLKGDMSLVGPRPLLIEYLPLYNNHQRKRHIVKPGITGLAQVNGRNNLSWEEKFDFDVYYVENLTFQQDLLIIGKTIIKVFSKEDVNRGEETIMPLFKGDS